jgi:hypothetical protein
MDAAMMKMLLDSYGAADTPDNANRIRQFAAANPDVLERRAMGMRGSGVDDNSDLLKPMLDKFMAATDTGGASRQGNYGEAWERAPAPPVQSGPRGPSFRAPSGSDSRGPVVEPQAMIDSFGPRTSEPTMVNQPPPPAQDNSSWLERNWPWLVPIIGGGALYAARQAGRNMPIGGEPNVKNAPTDNPNARGRGAGAGGLEGAITNELRGVRSMSDLDAVARKYGLDNQQAYDAWKRANPNTSVPPENPAAQGRGAGAGGMNSKNVRNMDDRIGMDVPEEAPKEKSTGRTRPAADIDKKIGTDLTDEMMRQKELDKIRKSRGRGR